MVNFIGPLIALFLITLLFSINIKYYSISIILIFTFSFFQGVLQLIGIPTIVPRFLLESSILFLFLKTIFLSQRYNLVITFKWGYWILSIFFITIASSIINKQDPISVMLFMRHTFIFYLLFVTVYNTDISIKNIKMIRSYLIGLFIIQIPASIIKLISYGRIVEGGGIGTISVQDGSAALLLSLFPISFLFSKYLYNKRTNYLLYCILFLIISIASGKRATAFLLPLLMLFIFTNYLYVNDQKRLKKIFQLSYKIIIISFFMLYITSQTSSFLSPSGRAFSGEFDLKFLYNRMILYSVASEAVNPGAGRANAISSTYKYVSNSGIEYLLFGFGPGSIIGSFVVQEKRSIGTMHNLPYANRSGFVWLFLQIGLIGAMFYLFFIINWFLSTIKVYKISRFKNSAPGLLGIIGALFILMFDVSLYSTSFITNGVTMPVLIYLSAIYLSPFRLKREFSND